MRLPEEIEKVFEEIKADNRSGSQSIVIRTAEALSAIFELPVASEAEKCFELAAQELDEMIKAHPAMASLYSLRDLFHDEVPATTPESMAIALGNFADSILKSTVQIARNASELIKSGDRIITISYSSLVAETLSFSAGMKESISVICMESRPICEGRDFASYLAERGIEVMLCSDAIGTSLVKECDLVLVGADALLPKGLVNKIGTYPLALAAREARTQFVALINTQKIRSKIETDFNRDHDPKELLEIPIENVEVINRYFDLTPLDFVTTIVTEDGAYGRT